MHATKRNSVGYQGAVIRADLRTPMISAGRWTGRARVSTATNTAVPRCVTTTTHRTRVSEIRSLLSRLIRELSIAPRSSSETSSLQRRDQGLPTHSSG
jgi:hypothetical protein